MHDPEFRQPAGDEERHWRYTRLDKALDEHELDAIIAFGPAWRREDVRYLSDTALMGDAGLVIHRPGAGTFGASTHDVDLLAFTDAAWVDVAERLEFGATSRLASLLSDALRGASRVGVSHLELAPRALTDLFSRVAPDAEYVSASALMDGLRRVKSDWEISQLRRASAVCTTAWETFVDTLAPGVPEYRVVAAVEADIKRQGGADNFMLIASGGDEVRGMTPPTDRRLEPGDMVRTELTPQVNGYWQQLCRSATVGPPSEAQRRSFELFDEAVEAGIAAVRPGATAHDVAKAENDVFRQHGYGEYCTPQYTRVRGHGLGIHLDEFPVIEGNETVLEEGAVLIVHPNTFTPIAGYHVLGDPVVVTSDGCEVLVDVERRLFHSDETSSR